MILIAISLVLLLGLMAVGGRVSNLAQMKIKWGWLAPLAFFLQACLIFVPGEVAGGLLSSRALILILSNGLLFVVVWHNRRLPGVKLIGLGLLLNLIVMVMNGGFMPITPEALVRTGYDGNVPRLETGYLVGRTKNVVIEPGEARLWFLSDILVIPRPFPIPSAMSVGDLFIVGGIFLFLRHSMSPRAFMGST